MLYILQTVMNSIVAQGLSTEKFIFMMVHKLSRLFDIFIWTTEFPFTIILFFSSSHMWEISPILPKEFHRRSQASILQCWRCCCGIKLLLLDNDFHSFKSNTQHTMYKRKSNKLLIYIIDVWHCTSKMNMRQNTLPIHTFTSLIQLNANLTGVSYTPYTVCELIINLCVFVDFGIFAADTDSANTQNRGFFLSWGFVCCLSCNSFQSTSNPSTFHARRKPQTIHGEM